MREIVFDTETTGIMPGDGHRIVEIGALELMDRISTGRTFHSYIDPCRAMPRDAEGVHGLTTAFLTGQPVFEAVIDEFLAFIGDAPLVAHNAAFDMAFLNWELRRAGLRPLPDSRAICTLELSRARHPGAKHSLDALCTRYDIDLSGRSKHGALLDAELLARVYIELTGGRQIDFDLASASVAAAVALPRTMLPPRPHAASAAELARHAAMVAGLKDPVWLQ
jgi:DNA polymerase-3 subunit epsilon